MLVGVDTLVWYLSRWFSFKLFKSLSNSWWPDFFKKNFSNVRSEIQLIRIDMVSTGQSVRAYSGLYWEYPLASKVDQWFQKFNHLNFSKNYSGLQLPNLNFVACVKICISSQELSTRSTFSNHIHYFIYIFNVSFHLMSCQEFCKYYMC